MASALQIRSKLVICYHAVSPTWPSALAIHPAELDRQVSVLIGRGYRPQTFADAMLGTDEGPTFSVTFDDAYQSVWAHAKPVLDRLAVPATIFVPTDHAETGKPLEWGDSRRWLGTPHADELIPLTWRQMNALFDHGWEMASHGHSHVQLTSLDDESLESEIETSRELLAANISMPRTFAYPFGDHDGRVRRVVEAAGFEAAAAAPLPAEPYVADRMQWPRVGVYRGGSSRLFRVRTLAITRSIRASTMWRRLHEVGGRRQVSVAMAADC